MAFLQSLVAERHMTVPQQPQALLPSNKALWGRITRWRGARGLLKCPSPNLGSQHQDCSLKGPFTELPGGLYMCESCGWAHLCGEGCSEKLVDEVSESLVCPISGRCFDRMINDAEVLCLSPSLSSAGYSRYASVHIYMHCWETPVCCVQFSAEICDVG